MNRCASFKSSDSQKNRLATRYNHSGVLSDFLNPNLILVEKRAQASKSIKGRKQARQGIKIKKLPKFREFNIQKSQLLDTS